jgi:hypothetical protein
MWRWESIDVMETYLLGIFYQIAMPAYTGISVLRASVGIYSLLG